MLFEASDYFILKYKNVVYQNDSLTVSYTVNNAHFRNNLLKQVKE